MYAGSLFISFFLVMCEQTVNDVITGIILYGSRMYMEEESFESRNANSSALVVFNTRNIGRYKSVDEMVKPNANKLWGNQFTLSHVPIPKLSHVGNSSNPLEFIREVHKTMDRKKKSSAVYMTASLIECVRKFRGPEVHNIILQKNKKLHAMRFHKTYMCPVLKFSLCVCVFLIRLQLSLFTAH